MPANEIVVMFPITGPSREDYLHLVETDDSEYFLAGSPLMRTGRTSLLSPTFLGFGGSLFVTTVALVASLIADATSLGIVGW